MSGRTNSCTARWGTSDGFFHGPVHRRHGSPRPSHEASNSPGPFPGHAEFDVTDPFQMAAYLAGKTVSTIFHAAAFTSPPKINENPKLALDVNIIGTANVVRLCMERNIKLLYVSTDYVFKGDSGMYKEDDPVLPANKYAWSKLAGECAVRMYDNSLIIRTSFGDTVFPYEKAFVDQWTSRLRVDVLAKKLVKLLESDLTGTIHVGGKRQTVMDYANPSAPTKRSELCP